MPAPRVTLLRAVLLVAGTVSFLLLTGLYTNKLKPKATVRNQIADFQKSKPSLKTVPNNDIQVSNFEKSKPSLKTVPNNDIQVSNFEKSKPSLKTVPNNDTQMSSFQKSNLQLKTVPNNDTEKEIPPGRYSVISCSHFGKMSRYVSSIPFAVRAWKRLGYGVIVLLIGTPQQWKSIKSLAVVINYTTKFGGRVFFVPVAKEAYQVRVGMVARLFTGNLVKFQDPKNTILATTDSDNWPINSGILDIPQGFTFYSLDSCGSFNHKGQSYTMLQMMFLIASVQTWMDIMNVPTTPQNSDEILEDMINMFGSRVLEPVKKGFNDGWFMDQHFVSVKVKNYFQLHKNLAAKLRDIRPSGARLHLWDSAENLSRLSNREDAHVTLDLMTDDAWRKAQILIRAMYKPEEGRELEDYRTELLKLIRS